MARLRCLPHASSRGADSRIVALNGRTVHSGRRLTSYASPLMTPTSTLSARRLVFAAAAFTLLSARAPLSGQATTAEAPKATAAMPDKLSDIEYWKMVTDLSEP